MPSAPGDFESFAEWLAYAAASPDGGASISRYFPPSEVDAAAPGFVDELAALSRAVRPLIDWVYPDDGAEDADSRTPVDGSTSVEPPPGFRREVFDAAVAELKRERLERGDLHQLACRQLTDWLDGRASLTDEAFWAGLRDRFLPFGHVEIDGSSYDARNPSPLSETELRAAGQQGRAIAHGNLHWTGLARAVGSVRDDVSTIRAAIDWLLDESIPFKDRIAALVGGERHVRGFGIAVWTGLYAMARRWAQPAVNETVIGAYDKLAWPLDADGPAERVAEVRARGEKLLRESGLRSLSDIDWVYWRVLDMKSATPMAPEDSGRWWLFQANPARWDIDRALVDLERLTWTMNQHATEIEAGHRVFLYRTGPEAAIVALATVESDPAEMPDDDGDHSYWRDAGDRGSGSSIQVRLRIDRLVDPPLTRGELLADPILRDLGNLKFANNTNYSVPPELASRLLSRIKGEPPDTVDPSDASSVPGVLRSVAAAAGLWFEPWVLEDLYLALRTKPFLILTGLSGTGKTKVALALQDLLADADTRAFVSVRPDWVDGKSLLGYHNLLTDTFVSTPTTRLLLDAQAEFTARGHAARPYILLLDEMNLARVEHYLADYLSVLESRRSAPDGSVIGDPIALHTMGGDLPGSGDHGLVPATVHLAPNVYVIGTVNIDETTHPFSRKVLDRANVVELFDVDLTRSGTAAVAAIDDAARRQVRTHFTRAGRFVDLAEPSLGTPWLTELVAVNAVLAAIGSTSATEYGTRRSPSSNRPGTVDSSVRVSRLDRWPSTSSSSRKSSRSSRARENASSARSATSSRSALHRRRAMRIEHAVSLMTPSDCSPRWEWSPVVMGGRRSNRSML